MKHNFQKIEHTNGLIQKVFICHHWKMLTISLSSQGIMFPWKIIAFDRNDTNPSTEDGDHLKIQGQCIPLKRAFPFTLRWPVHKSVWNGLIIMSGRETVRAIDRMGHSSIVINCGCDGYPSPDLPPSDQTRGRERLMTVQTAIMKFGKYIKFGSHNSKLTLLIYFKTSSWSHCAWFTDAHYSTKQQVLN